MISTKNVNKDIPKKGSKREKVQALTLEHTALFKKEGVTNPKFIPRLCYNHKEVKVIGFYPKEMYGGKDIYIEFCSRDFTPEDPKRTLYKWVYDSEHEIKYEATEPHPATGDKRYLIPISKLINVSEFYSKPEVIIKEETINLDFDEEVGAGSDVPFDAMTLRDYAAIKWQKPVSGKKWLNELITKNFK